MMKQEKELTNYFVSVKLELFLDLSIKSKSEHISKRDVLNLITPKMVKDSFEECRRDLGTDIVEIEECYDKDNYCCP